MIFISHATQDDDFVDELLPRLRQAGYQTWVDHNNSPGGRHWDEVVDEQLKRSEVMILVLSPDSVASRNVKAEWKEFYQLDKLIIPVVRQPCVRPLLIRHLSYIDFSQDDPDVAFNKLLEALPKGLHKANVTANLAALDPTDSQIMVIRDKVRKLELSIKQMVGRDQILFTFPEVERSLLVDLSKEKLFVGWRREVDDFKPDVDLTNYGAFAAGVSRQHALLERRRASYLLSDLGSTNGTFVDRERLKIDMPVPLPNRSVVRFGGLAAQVFYRED